MVFVLVALVAEAVIKVAAVVEFVTVVAGAASCIVVAFVDVEFLALFCTVCAFFALSLSFDRLLDFVGSTWVFTDATKVCCVSTSRDDSVWC